MSAWQFVPGPPSEAGLLAADVDWRGDAGRRREVGWRGEAGSPGVDSGSLVADVGRRREVSWRGEAGSLGVDAGSPGADAASPGADVGSLIADVESLPEAISAPARLAASGPPTRPKRRRPQLAIGLVLFAIPLIATLAAPLLAPADPTRQDIRHIFAPPGPEHLLGTDQLGRDVLSRLLYGGRLSLTLTAAAVAVAVVVGLVLAIFATLPVKGLDSAIGRLADIQLAVPSMLIAIIIVVFTKGSYGSLIAVLVIAGWVMPFRMLRNVLQRAYAQPYIEAASVSGLSRREIIRRHLIPELLPHLAVVTSLVFAGLLVFEASLGFLGIGVKPPTPEWGQMVSEGRAQVKQAWWVALPAGAALVTVLVGIQLLADAIADRYSITGIIRRRR